VQRGKQMTQIVKIGDNQCKTSKKHNVTTLQTV